LPLFHESLHVSQCEIGRLLTYPGRCIHAACRTATSTGVATPPFSSSVIAPPAAAPVLSPSDPAAWGGDSAWSLLCFTFDPSSTSPLA
jgi:hypothetical protein